MFYTFLRHIFTNLRYILVISQVYLICGFYASMYDPRTCFYLRPRSRDMAILSIEAQEVEYVLSSKGEMPISWPIYVEKVKTS